MWLRDVVAVVACVACDTKLSLKTVFGRWWVIGGGCGHYRRCSMKSPNSNSITI